MNTYEWLLIILIVWMHAMMIMPESDDGGKTRTIGGTFIALFAVIVAFSVGT